MSGLICTGEPYGFYEKPQIQGHSRDLCSKTSLRSPRALKLRLGGQAPGRRSDRTRGIVVGFEPGSVGEWCEVLGA